MLLAEGFQFSQASLQDYADCPRRFELRHVQHVAWPAVEAEPALEHERYLQQGAAFHRLVHQHLLGIPADKLSASLRDPTLRGWWRDYLERGPTGLPATRYPELALSAPLSDYRLVAKFDLIAAEPGQRAVIVDWKTSRRRPSREWLAGRLQTRVYPYLLVRAGQYLNGGQPLQPEQVEMLYWFTNDAATPERFVYDAARYRADEATLMALVAEIAGSDEDGFPLTSDERRCRTCPYRSLCLRGGAAGALREIEEEESPEDVLDLALDLEQIAEIEY
jgi:hypothetical protein